MTAPHDAATGTSPDQVVPAATQPCACPATPGVTVTDRAAHDAWHSLVVEQGGPAGVVDMLSLQRARGAARAALLSEVEPDPKARRRAYATLRRRAIAVLT